MARHGRFALVIGLAALFGAVQGQEKKSTVITGWGTWIDPDGDCKVVQDGGKVTITVPKTVHDLSYNDKYTKLNAPRILQKAGGDFELQVTVPAIPVPDKGTSSSGFVSFHSCGLIVYVDDTNYIRMERASEGDAGTEFIWVERFSGGKPAAYKFHPVANKETALLLQRTGSKLTFAISQEADAKTWTEIHTDEAELPKNLQVGVVAINTTPRVFAPELRALKVTAK